MMTVLNVILWILAVIGGILALILLILLLLLILPIGVRLSNGYEKLHVWLKIWFIRIKLTPKKELTEEEKAKKAAKKARKAEKKKAKKEKKKRKAEEKARKAAEKQKTKKPQKHKKKAKKLPKPPAEKDTLGTVRALWASLRDYDYPYAKLFCVRNLTLVATVGGDGPAETGRNYGRAAEYFGILYPYVTRVFHIKRHRIHVNPDFVHNQTQIKFDVTVTVTLGKFLKAAFVFWRSFKRNKRIYCKPQAQDRGNNRPRQT